jgi:hypothetical protein
VRDRFTAQKALGGWLLILVKVLSWITVALIIFLILNNKQHISASLVPKSIVKSFNSTHPSATNIEYVLNVDDSGISYFISYTQNNTRYTKEYNYSEWAQIDFDYAEALDEKQNANNDNAGITKTSF